MLAFENTRLHMVLQTMVHGLITTHIVIYSFNIIKNLATIIYKIKELVEKTERLNFKDTILEINAMKFSI